MGGTRVGRNSRRTVAVATTLLLAATVVTTARSLQAADATSGAGHNPYEVPLATDVDPALNVFETTIVADEMNGVDLGNGLTGNVLTFNGTIPGPEIRVKVNDTVIVHFENHLAHPTGIHWHGIEDDNASDGTPLTQNMVQPGDKFLYKFTVPRPGVFWYHPHHHSSTNQVFKGLYGSLIVTDPGEATLQADGVLPSQANTKTLVLGDITVCKNPTSGSVTPKNDAHTYSGGPWAGGGALPQQQAPNPTDLCDTPIDEDGNPIGAPLNFGDVPNIQRLSGPTNEGQTLLTNGMNVGGRDGSPHAADADFPPGNLQAGAQTLPVLAGDGIRLQVINTAPIRFMRLRLTGDAGAQIPLVRVGGEGGLLDTAVLDGGHSPYDFFYDEGEILLGPGDRTDVVAAIPPGTSGPLTLWTLDFVRQGIGGNGGLRFVNVPTVPVAHFSISGNAPTPYSITPGVTGLLTHLARSTEVLPAPTGGFITPSGGFDPCPGAPPVCGPKSGMASQDIQLTATGSGSTTGINNVQGLHDFVGDYTVAPKVGSTRYAAEVGDTLELSVTNATEAHHPFHPHGFSIQPIAYEKPAGTVVYDDFPHEFIDEINVPAKTTLRYRVRLDERPLMDGVTPGGAYGRWVFHCHIFFHAVFGMISEIIVTDADGNERPYVNSDDVETAAVNPGDVATMTGTFSDLDGDPVTITSSVGAIVQAAGTWSWSHTVNSLPPNGLVYVTATDATGLKDQIAFEVQVNNTPPTLDPIDDKTSNEGDLVNVSADFTDPDAADQNHSAVIDWGDGDGPQPATVDQVNDTITGSNTYGDNGTFTATVTVTDSFGGSDSESFDVVVSNVLPDASISPAGTVLINGVPTLIIQAGQNPLFSGHVTDPGSDDETMTWHWGDGKPDDVLVSLVNDPNSDPPASPSVQPRNITYQVNHRFDSACLFHVTFTALDDDGGSDTDTREVIVTGTTTKRQSIGWWGSQYNLTGTGTQYSVQELDCFLSIANFMSTVFSETVPTATRPQAAQVLANASPDDRAKLDRELLAAWLNFATGSVKLTTLFDGTTFAQLMANAEAVRNNPLATSAQLKAQTKLVHKINPT
jgi:FtsP/CotA-like multicopper oxidase with cupredoxin domain